MNRQINTEPAGKYSAVPPQGYMPKKPTEKKRLAVFLLISALCLVCAAVTVPLSFFGLGRLAAKQIDASNAVSQIPPLTASAQLSAASAMADIDISEAPPEPELVLYDFMSPVPESEPVDYDYFKDTVFIGDSRTQGLLLYTRITPYNFAAQGANISTIQTRAYIHLTNDDGESVNYTLTEALELESGEYKSIYLSTGVNELGWNVDRFIEQYTALIDSIREVTDVPIYIQLIMPVTTEFSETTVLTNENAAIFNERLRTLAAERSLFLLDPTGIHALEDGSLDPEHSYDGAHLWPKSYIELADYYRTHIVDIYAWDNTQPSSEESEADQTYFTDTSY